MNVYFKFILLSTFLTLLSACKIGGALRDFHSLSRNIDDVSKEATPVDTLLMKATSGLLTELSSADSQEKLDSITARLNRSLTQYLNETIKNLDVGPLGSKFTQGALDPVLAAETQERMKQLIAALSAQVSHDITGMIGELTSPANKAKLNSLLMSFFSEANSKVLSNFINRSLRGIQFDSLGSRVANQVIAQNIKPEIDSVTRTAVRAIFDEIRHGNNAKGLFGDIKNVLFLGFGILGIIIGLLLWWNRRKSVKLNQLLVNAIEDLDDHTGKDVKTEVAKKARSAGLLSDLHKLIDQQQLFKKKET